jgi:hypothetical protein
MMLHAAACTQLKQSPSAAQQVRDRLLGACLEAGAQLRCKASVEAISRRPAGEEQAGPGWSCTLADGSVHSADRLVGTRSCLSKRRTQCGVIFSDQTRSACEENRALLWGAQIVATGGLSFPKMGTDGTGHRLVAKVGHEPSAVYPALTPLQGPHPAGAQLAGLSLIALSFIDFTVL